MLRTYLGTKLYHYTSKSAATSVEASGVLNPGPGNYGKGVYLTGMTPGVYSNYEIKLAVRNPTISHDLIAKYATLDYEQLAKKYKIQKKLNMTYFIETDKPIDISDALEGFYYTPKD